MGDKRRIKKAPIETGQKIKKTEDHTSYIELAHPIFCFRFIHRDFGLDNCEDGEKIDLVDRIRALSQLTWKHIQFAPKHGFGSEKIPQSSIKSNITLPLSKDVDLLALRFSGKKPMVGHRNGSIFHIMFLDRSFNLYNH